MFPICKTKKEKYTKQLGRPERGQAIILIVFSIIGLIGMIALAVDGGRAFLEKRNSQNVADSVALGGALARIKGPQSEWVDTAYGIAKASGYDNNGESNSVAVYSPPVTGRYMDDVEYIQVIITSYVSAYFGTVVGLEKITVTSDAISRTKNSELTQILDGNAVISLRPTSECENVHDMSFWIHGESTLSITGGGLFVNSNNPSCALIQSGSGGIRFKDKDREIKVVGGADIKKPQLITPFPPSTGSAPISYPPPFFMPQVGCHKPVIKSLDGLTLSPGSWEEPESFPPKGVRYLEPGVYCITNNDFIAKGDDALEGRDVIIKVEGGKIEFGGNTEVDLRAPDQGDLAGLLIYMPMDNHKPITLNGNNKSRFNGTILAPGAEIHLNGNASKYGFHSQIIGYSVLSDGTSDIKITYTDEENLDAYTMPEVQLIK